MLFRALWFCSIILLNQALAAWAEIQTSPSQNMSLQASNFHSANLPTIVLRDSSIEVAASGAMFVFEDKSADLQLEGILNSKSAVFYHYDKPVFNEGYADSAYWLRLAVRDDRQRGRLIKNWLLEVESPTLTRVSLYTPTSVGRWKKETVGSALPYEIRKYNTPNIVFDLPLQRGQTQIIYLRIESNSLLSAPLSIWDRDHYFNSEADKQTLWGIYFGVMAVMLLYNAIIWIKIGSKGYVYYISFLASLIVAIASLQGYGHKYLWGSWPVWNEISFTLLTSIMLMTGSIATKTYLQINKVSKSFDKALLALGGAALIPAVLAVLHQQTYIRVTASIALIVTLSLSVVSMIGVVNKVRAASFFLITWGALLIGVTIFTLHRFGMLAPSAMALYAIHIGSGVAVALLSLLASADRISFAQKEAAVQETESRKNLHKYSLEKHERQNAETEKALVEAQNKANSQFFASISHELRTPLTAVLGYATVAKNPQMSAVERIKKVEIIEKSGRHLLRLVNNTLDLSKIESQKLECDILPVNLVELVADIEDYVVILADKKKLIFNSNYQFPLPETFDSDPTRLKQVLINLISNAIKFTETGSVTLEIYTTSFEWYICFAVKDTGIGIKANKINTLFEAISRPDVKKLRYSGDTDLGLYLSKQIIQQLQGDIKVTSTYGKGSEFTVMLPITVTAKLNWLYKLPELPSPGRDDVPKLQGLVLYAEDNPQNQQLIAELISRTGCRVTIANDGSEALNLVSQADFDIVLTDIRMPIMDGVEFNRQLKRVKPNLPVVAITAEYTAGDLSELEQEAFADILFKPVSNHKFYAVLLKYLEKSDNHGIFSPENINELSSSSSVSATDNDFNDEHNLSENSFSEVEMDNRVTALNHYFQTHVSRLLIVDDDEFVIDITKTMLLPLSVSIDIASTYDAGRSLVENNQYSIALLDAKLPGTPDFEMIREVATGNGQSVKTKILCISGVSTPSEIEQIYRAGADLHITKPFTADSLFEALATLLKVNNDIECEYLAFDTLVRRSGDKALAIKKLIAFKKKYQDAPTIIAQFIGLEKIGSEKIDFTEFEIYVHKLGSSIGFLAADELMVTARAIEVAVKNKNIDKVKAIIDEKHFISALKKLLNEIHNYHN